MAINTWEDYLAKAGKCSACQRVFDESETYQATLAETDGGFERKEYCQRCWKDDFGEQVFSFWQATVPVRAEKRKLLVDDQVLLQIFDRLLELDDESKRGFTFVLALILMRKRVLKYINTARQDGAEWWVMKRTGKDDECRILNPNLTEQELEAIQGQLGEVLAGD